MGFLSRSLRKPRSSMLSSKEEGTQTTQEMEKVVLKEARRSIKEEITVSEFEI